MNAFWVLEVSLAVFLEFMIIPALTRAFQVDITPDILQPDILPDIDAANLVILVTIGTSIHSVDANRFLPRERIAVVPNVDLWDGGFGWVVHSPFFG